MRKLFLLLTIFIHVVGYSQSCSTLTNNFTSYNQAISVVENSSFKIDESVNTSKSSWILSAHYYSCDGKTGFFIIRLKQREYIHANMPVSIWREFKRANSFGSFYDYYIKGRYRIYLN